MPEMPSPTIQRDRLIELCKTFKGDLIQHRMTLIERLGDTLCLWIDSNGLRRFEIAAASHEDAKPYDVWIRKQTGGVSIHRNALTKDQVVAWIKEIREKT